MIKRIIIHNLKAIDSLTIDFKQLNSITGRNGVGKSTIKEALTFVLYGKINNTDRIDEAIRNGEKEAKVTIVLNKAGKDLIVSRTRSTKGSTLEINGRLSEQSDIQALFGSYDYFVCGNFIGEFMKYSESERRQLLLNMFDPLDRTMIFRELTGEDPKDYDLNNLDATEKTVKSQLRSMENNMILLSSQKETLNADLFRLKDDLNNLKTSELVNNSNKILDLKLKLDAILVSKPNQLEFVVKKPDTDDIDRAISKLNLEMINLKEPQDPNVIALEMSLTQSKNEYNRVKTSTNCPTCNRPYDDVSHINTRLVELEAQMKKEFGLWKERKANLETSVKVYNETRLGINEKIASLNANKEELLMSVDMMQSEMDERYSQSIGKWNLDSQVIREELDKLSASQQAYETQAIKIDSAKQNIVDLEFKISKIMEEIKKNDMSTLDKVVKAFGPKGIKFQELLSQQKQVNDKLPDNIVIEFMKENKTTDGFKPVFNVIMDGVAYPWLSTGMKMFADFNLLKLFKGSFIVVDNYESYTGVIPDDLKDRQTILLSAVDSDIKIETSDNKAVKQPVKKSVKKPVKKVVKKATKAKAK